MGKKNRQRRAEKQRQRQRTSVTQPAAWAQPSPSGAPPRAPASAGGGSPRRKASSPSAADVSDLIRLAARARSVRELADRTVVLDVLAARAEEPGGRAVVDAGLALSAGSLLAGLWEDGWQPVDLVRLVGHRSSAAHRAMLVDEIARQALDLPMSLAPPAWQDQLDDVGATVWWDERRPLLEQWAERSGHAARMLLEVAVVLLGTLLTLPTQPRLCPPPSAWSATTARTGQRGAAGLDAKVLTKVRALLAKAESTEFPEEAEALSAKAQELITRHAIDQALLAPDDRADDAPPGGRRIPVDDPYAAGKAHLLQAIASANRCRMVWDKAHGFCTVFGYPGDLDAVELLHASLLVQATSAMAAAGSQVDASGVSRTRSFRSSFLTAFAARIGERLRATTRSSVAAVDEALGDGRLLPVLAAREDAVEAAVAEAFPTVVAHRAGWVAGRVAADRAELAVGPRLADQRRLSA